MSEGETPLSNGGPEFYDALAGALEDDYYGVRADPCLAFDVEQVRRALMRLIGPGMSILEVGCGSGYWIRTIESKFPDSQVFGIDYATGMVREAQRHSTISPVLAEAASIPFRSACFDAVISPWSALDHCVNYALAFQEVSRLLAPGGRVCLMVDNRQRRVPRYWHVNSARVESIESDPRHDDNWVNIVDGKRVTVFTHMFTIEEVIGLLPDFDLEFFGIGLITPFVPWSIRRRWPFAVTQLIRTLAPLERWLSRSAPRRAALLIVSGVKKSATP